MDAEKKRLRDEVAELAEAVRTLRDELVIARAVHHCHGCHCVYPVWVYPNVISPRPWQWQIPSVTVSSGSSYTATNALSQGN